MHIFSCHTQPDKAEREVKRFLLPTSNRLSSGRWGTGIKWSINRNSSQTSTLSSFASVFCGSLQFHGMTNWLSDRLRLSINVLVMMLYWQPGNKHLSNCFVRHISIFYSALELRLLSVGLGTLLLLRCFSWEGINMMSGLQSVAHNCCK